MDFNDFWQLYPRKEAKIKAENAWKRIAQKDHEAIAEDLAKRKWPAERHFIMLPATYLNGRRWEDETQKGRSTAAPERPYHAPSQVQRLPKTEHRTRSASEHLEAIKRRFGRSTATQAKS